MAVAYCLCRKPYEPNEFMIECEVCKEWFHGRCVGVLENQATDIEIYHCPKCQLTHGPLKLKKRRTSQRPDLTKSDDSGNSKTMQTGSVSFVHELKRRTFPSADKIPIIHLTGHQVTKDYFEQHGFDFPILVDGKEGLDLKVPASNFSIQDVENHVGSMREIDVIDVARQEDCKMLMREWTEYYNSPERLKIFNVISLEFSGTSLASLVAPPRIVTELSWVNKYWQMALSVNGPPLQKPEVHRYCLMGVKDSFTDFHIDFGGTSVWYHVLRGEKVFYLIKPTPANMVLYERWLSSSNQSEMFFGDQVDACYKCVVKQSQTLFVPTGWIHAVLTPIDSLVFGGNFLHDFNIEMQLKVYDIEKRVKTQDKYLFPCYESLHWYAAKAITDTINSRLKSGGVVPRYLISSLKALFTALKSWSHKKDPVRMNMIPVTIQHTKVLKDLQKFVKDLKMCEKGKNYVEKKSLALPSPDAISGSKPVKPKTKRSAELSDGLSNMPTSSPKKNSPKKKRGVMLELPNKEQTVNNTPTKSNSSSLVGSQSISTTNNFTAYDFTVEDDLKHNKDFALNSQRSPPKPDSRFYPPNLFSPSLEKQVSMPDNKDDANMVLKLRMVGSKVMSGEEDMKVKNEGFPQPFNIGASTGFPLKTPTTTSSSLQMKMKKAGESDDDDDDAMLVVDETPSKSRVPSANLASTAIKPASLKLKLSVSKSLSHQDSYQDSSWSNTAPSSGHTFMQLSSVGSSSNSEQVTSLNDFANRLAMPVIRGGLNSSISDILEVSGYGTETDIKIDGDIGRASPTMRDAIQGMLSMSQMGRTTLLSPSSSSLLSSSTAKGRLGQSKMPKYDEFEFDMPTCYKDDEFVYPTLDISDTEDDLKAKARTNSKQDEAWNPKGAKLAPNRPKPDRPKRHGARKESVESGLAAAAAKFLNRPPPKRQYNRKKPKLEKKLFVSGLSSDPTPSTSLSTLSSGSPLSPTLSPTLSLSTSGALNPEKSPVLMKCKKPKKGMATAKQRLAQKLKMHKMMF